MEPIQDDLPPEDPVYTYLTDRLREGALCSPISPGSRRRRRSSASSEMSWSSRSSGSQSRKVSTASNSSWTSDTSSQRSYDGFANYQPPTPQIQRKYSGVIPQRVLKGRQTPIIFQLFFQKKISFQLLKWRHISRSDEPTLDWTRIELESRLNVSIHSWMCKLIQSVTDLVFFGFNLPRLKEVYWANSYVKSKSSLNLAIWMHLNFCPVSQWTNRLNSFHCSIVNRYHFSGPS